MDKPIPEVVQRHVVTKYRDGSVHVADVTAPPSAPVGVEAQVSALQSTRDRMMAALTPKFGDAFDGDFDVMLEAINTMKRFRTVTLAQQPAAKGPFRVLCESDTPFTFDPARTTAEAPLAQQPAAVDESLPDFLDRIAGELVSRDTIAGTFAPGIAESLRGRAIVLRTIATQQQEPTT